ncbi:hypothetical protein MHM88_14610 [Epibacterium sp. MM17-32]|uniref:hypothetical protein n=1 Tax=Epibacterium sp. MM17-32 TaxID=2917734 RepID=UPI001EF3FD3D|nr:hypothetical protein [Epibacterium sp. MM17-32]MCG7629040.1 hypothetical protein [Epibacterium sp. MM17-32]
MIEFFAIRHKPSGGFLPAPKGRGGRGGSHVEPVPPSEVNPPRLFHSKHAASVALTHWLKGAVTVDYVEYDFGEVDELWNLDPKPHRKREDMEVVPVKMELPQ